MPNPKFTAPPSTRQRGYPLRHSYRSRPLRPQAKAALETILPHLTLDSLLLNEKQLNPLQFFPVQPAALWLEIGFGSGQYLLRAIKENPTTAFIGCEIYRPGIAKFLNHLPPPAYPRLRIYTRDATSLLSRLPAASLDKIILLYPDPWPKYRHRQRRFIQTPTLHQLARLMKPAATLLFASDDPQLTAWTLAHFLAHPAFDWLQTRSAIPAPPFLTQYEQKAARAHRRAIRLVFSRKPC